MHGARSFLQTLAAVLAICFVSGLAHVASLSDTGLATACWAIVTVTTTAHGRNAYEHFTNKTKGKPDEPPPTSS